MSELERIQKVLSQLGIGSRREIERLIQQGAIKVNGAIAQLGDKISVHDQVWVNHKKITLEHQAKDVTRMIIYYKPVGEICSRQDPLFKKTVFDHLPPIQGGRWIQIGRLDLNTSGLLIFTNQGDLAHQMMHPSFSIEREYAVRVFGQVTDEMIKKLKEGVELEDGLAKFKDVVHVGGEGMNAWYHVVLTEGKNREVRRLWQSQGVEVSRLIRVRFGPIVLPRFLSQGKWIEAKPAQVNELVRYLGMNHGSSEGR
jgi:23S rRNA pseudouridine2605 synthase